MNTKTKTSAPRKSNNSVSWAQAVRDIFVTSMNRGQLPVLGMIAIVLLLIWKMPEADAGRLMHDLLSALRAGEMWSYGLLLATLAGWFFHAKFMRREFSDEALRIGREKSDLQGKLSGVKYESSDRK